MKGTCLCGAIRFETDGEPPNLYQCHCSLCRKQSGSSANAATVVHESKFSWKSGLDQISYFKKETGFTSNFCSTCGSPVPNQLRDTDKIWIPAGLLEDEGDLAIVVHICTGSKASWDEIPASAEHVAGMPDLESHYETLQPIGSRR